MKVWQPLTLGIVMGALGGAMGCADLVGADFDNLHPRPQGSGYDAAANSDAPAPREDGNNNEDTSHIQRGNADATGDQRSMAGDGAPGADVHAWSDVRDIGNGVDVTDDLDAGRARDVTDDLDASHSHDVPDIDDPGHSKDASDDLDAGHSNDVGDAKDDGSAVDAHPDPPDGRPPTVVVGGFVSLGVPTRTSSPIELRGHVISNAVVRGVTSTGISIEGKIQ